MIKQDMGSKKRCTYPNREKRNILQSKEYDKEAACLLKIKEKINYH